MKIKKVVDIKSKLEVISNAYGYEAQSRMLIEECAELIQAINKLYRKQNFGGAYIEILEATRNVKEEIVDVLIMISQVRVLLGIKDEDIDELIHEKLDRQLRRIDSKV